MGFSPSIGLAVLEILDHGLKRLAADVNGTSEGMIDRHDHKRTHERYGLFWQIAPTVLGDMMKDSDRARAFDAPFIRLFRK
jgi:predicted 3-demethylubiquinone-9 3-methyltransferase (glyoxalase superfamily)